jgi:hypothetical protein
MATCLPLLTSPSVWCSSVDCRQYRCRCHSRPGRPLADRRPPICEVVEVARCFSVGASVRSRDLLTMPTCWVQALRQPHTTATSAQLPVTAPTRCWLGRRRAGCMAFTQVRPSQVTPFYPQTSTTEVLGRYREVQAIVTRVVQLKNRSDAQPAACGLRKNTWSRNWRHRLSVIYFRISLHIDRLEVGLSCRKLRLSVTYSICICFANTTYIQHRKETTESKWKDE